MSTRWDVKLARLERIPLFAGCGRHQIEAIGRLGDVVTSDPGTVLAGQGRRGWQVLVIVDGSAAVSRDGTPIGTLGPGDVVGVVSVLGHQAHADTVTAETTTDLLVFDPRAFKRLLDIAPDVTRRMLTVVANRLHAA